MRSPSRVASMRSWSSAKYVAPWTSGRTRLPDDQASSPGWSSSRRVWALPRSWCVSSQSVGALVTGSPSAPEPGEPAPRREHTHRGSSGLDREHGAGGVEQDLLGVASEDQLAHRRPPAEPDHDQLGLDLAGDADQVLGGLKPPHEVAHLVLHTAVLELVAHLVELLLDLQVLAVAELPA